jgi:hypothetical protein
MVSSCCTGMLMIELLLMHCSGALRRRCTLVARFDDEVGESLMLTAIGGMNLRSITFAVILAIVSLPAHLAPTKNDYSVSRAHYNEGTAYFPSMYVFPSRNLSITEFRLYSSRLSRWTTV